MGLPWPRSLFGRNVLILAAATALSVWLSFFSIYVLILNAQIDRITSIAAELVNTLSAAALELDPDARDALIMRADEGEFLQIKPLGVPPEIGDYRENAAEMMVMQRIIDRLDYQDAMDWRIGENRTLWLHLRIGEEFYWVAAESSTNWTPIRWLLLLTSIITLVVTAIGALATREISRPLAALERETDRLALGSDWQLAEIRGPTEIKALARSFERMTTRLKEAETIRAETLAELSHDLRTPLARLRLAVEMMRDGEELKASAVRQVEQIDRLIDQFMDYARDARTEQMAELNLSGLVAEIADGFDIDAEVQPAIALIGQKELIRRAISNLVENALKYGAPPVHVHLRRAGADAVIEVSDGGSGFDPASGSDMLKPFRRGKHEARIAGSGLGLAIVDRVAASHTGEVFFQRLDPTGFVATLTLRLKTEA
ncbi:MAG: ATP-binding protein [Pseudomonadota bacterium]